MGGWRLCPQVDTYEKAHAALDMHHRIWTVRDKLCSPHFGIAKLNNDPVNLALLARAPHGICIQGDIKAK